MYIGFQDAIFLGSILSFILMLVYTKVDNKKLLFGFVLVLFYFVDQNYLAFIVGVIAGVIANKEYSMRKMSATLLILAGFLLGLFPPVLLPSYINIVTFYAVGAGLVIVGIHCSFSENPLLCNKFMEFWGKESLSLIVWQMLVLQSLNIFLFNYLYGAGVSNPINIAINFVVNIGAGFLLTWISSKTITPLTNYLCKKVSRLLWN